MDTPTTEMHLKPLLYRFAWVYTLTSVILSAVGYLLDEYADREIPSAVSAFTPFFVAIYSTAQLFVQTYAREITSGERIELAKKSTLVVLLINLVFAFITLIAFIYSGKLQMEAIRDPIMIGIAGLIIILFLLMSYGLSWLFYPQAIRSLLKNIKPPQ